MLQKHRSEVIDPGIAKHHGRTVKLMGDGLLWEFPSGRRPSTVLRKFSVPWLRAMLGHPKVGAKWLFRVGVHLGDVIVEDGDLYGDGVNIAARLEGIAVPGGICISRQAYDQVEKKVALGYRSLGPQTLKNIPDPVEVFAVSADRVCQAHAVRRAAIVICLPVVGRRCRAQS